MSTTRYNRNRNEWRKSYGTSRRKPVTKLFVDSKTGNTYSLDLNHVYRDRDYFQRDRYRPAIEAGTFPVGFYDEGLIYFDGSSSQGAAMFNITFPFEPLVVFTLEGDQDVDVNVFGVSKNTTGVTAGASAPFVGHVRYHAIYSDEYPAQFIAPDTSQFYASANRTATIQDDVFTGTFDYLDEVGSITKVLASPWNTPLNESNVHLELDSYDVTTEEVTGNLSAETTGDIDFIVYF